ncbi:MAG: GC-type dockerin domain-anchored protein, partial [Phycisphaerales bacterium]
GQLTVGCTPAGPDNDNCSSPAILRPGNQLSGSTIGANATGGDICFATSPDVWYEFYPPTSGSYTFDTCIANICNFAGLPNFDTVVSVHTDCSGQVLPLICNDDACGVLSRVTLNLSACTRYLVRVSGFGNSSGDFTLRASAAPAALAPSNDNCAGATPIGNGTIAVSTGGATTSTGVPAPPFSMFNDVWYRYCCPPGCGGPVTISTCESPAGINTALAAYSGACGSLALVASNDNALVGRCAGSTLSSLTFTAVAGQCYSIRVGSPVNGQTYCGRLNVVGPQPSLGTCPSGSVAGIRWFQVMGPSNNTPWSWCLSAPCCFNLSGNATGEPILTPAIDSRNALALRFVNSINASCGNGTNLVARAVPVSTTAGAGAFSIKARCNPPYAFPYFVFKVGSLGTSCDNQCIVAEVGGLNTFDPIPTSGPCSFNPPIMELPVSELDCNANQIDDLVDIVLGNATDSNGNGVPDSCEFCAADYNHDSAVDGDDVILFFQDWDPNHAAADVNHDGTVDGDDVIFFFNAWDSGC